MKIALDGMPLASPLTGVGHYTSELAKSLTAISPDDQFELISPDNFKRTLWNRRWWSIGLPLYLSRRSFDLFHGTNYEVPLWSQRPTVLTIHDLSLPLHPEAHEPHLVRRARWRLPPMLPGTPSDDRVDAPSVTSRTPCKAYRLGVGLEPRCLLGAGSRK